MNKFAGRKSDAELSDKEIKKILLDEHYISKTAADKAVKQAGLRRESLAEYLLSENIITKNIFGQAIAEHFGISYADLDKIKIDEDALLLLPELVSRANKAVVFARDKRGVKLGMMHPENMEIKHLLAKKTGAEVLPFFITKQDFDKAVSFYQAGLSQSFQDQLKKITDDGLNKEDKDEAVVVMTDLLFSYAYQNNASDIHIEPYKDKAVVRFRVDGIMHDVLSIPKTVAALVLTRIKILAKMRTDEHRAAQDGKLRFSFKKSAAPTNNASFVDMRISVIPVTEGENTVIRLLSDKGRRLGLSDLGMSATHLEIVNKTIKNPHGMILITGPTGSGKTTTLYAILKILNTREIHISTIEDPVEYDVEGISQMQVNARTGLTFAKGLRALVRQDPDIIMVGEIRDEETADIAINSAMTGHLVLSTLHTNDAATTLPRLLDMQIEPFLVSSTVNIAIAQRLVRKICSHCRHASGLSDEEKKIIAKNPKITSILNKKGHKTLASVRCYVGSGCNACGDTGFEGRTGIYEILELSEKVSKLIINRATSEDIAQAAISEGMTTMLEDGIDKVLEGLTTFKEVVRVAAI